VNKLILLALTLMLAFTMYGCAKQENKDEIDFTGIFAQYIQQRIMSIPGEGINGSAYIREKMIFVDFQRPFKFGSWLFSCHPHVQKEEMQLQEINQLFYEDNYSIAKKPEEVGTIILLHYSYVKVGEYAPYGSNTGTSCHGAPKTGHSGAAQKRPVIGS